MQVIDWIIFFIGCVSTIIVVLQRKAIKKHQRERTESLGMVLLLLAYLETQAREAKIQGGKQRT